MTLGTVDYQQKAISVKPVTGFTAIIETGQSLLQPSEFYPVKIRAVGKA